MINFIQNPTEFYADMSEASAEYFMSGGDDKTELVASKLLL